MVNNYKKNKVDLGVLTQLYYSTVTDVIIGGVVSCIQESRSAVATLLGFHVIKQK